MTVSHISATVDTKKPAHKQRTAHVKPSARRKNADRVEVGQDVQPSRIPAPTSGPTGEGAKPSPASRVHGSPRTAVRKRKKTEKAPQRSAGPERVRELLADGRSHRVKVTMRRGRHEAIFRHHLTGEVIGTVTSTSDPAIYQAAKRASSVRGLAGSVLFRLPARSAGAAPETSAPAEETPQVLAPGDPAAPSETPEVPEVPEVPAEASVSPVKGKHRSRAGAGAAEKHSRTAHAAPPAAKERRGHGGAEKKRAHSGLAGLFRRLKLG